jgi:hypothetical protein
MGISVPFGLLAQEGVPVSMPLFILPAACPNAPEV